ncbi:unnamed protein product [Lymnaea stagnalis]|uniref:Carboxylic ester hydrolase n=1 Tax=Lymnaea stagnalis TaxID=6523 RepID=A0AAV2H1N8_LYMST
MTTSMLLLCLVGLQVAAHALETGEVVSPVGKLRGLKVAAANGEPYWSFRGIPYAAPPVGDLRFAKPVPYPNPDQVIDGTQQGAACIQDPRFLSPNEIMSEDCLFLNIFAKEINQKSPVQKKVVIFIHGGGFFFGSTFIYNPGSFVTEQDVVFVTIQYRFGLFGFLTTEDENAPGNYGLWDQALALKWVKNNIAAFGGDPSDITIAGESAGGSSVSFLTLSPVPKDLFTKAYSSSGVATSLFAVNNLNKEAARAIAIFVNCLDKDETRMGKEVIQCLRSRQLSDFASFPLISNSRTLFHPWGDGEFLPKSPFELIKDEQYLEQIGFYQKKYLFGLTNQETTIHGVFLFLTKAIIYNDTRLTEDEKFNRWHWYLSNVSEEVIADRLQLDNTPPALLKKLRDWYQTRNPTPYDVLQLLADANFIIPTFDLINTVARSRNAESWLLYFNHYPQFMKGDLKGVIHAMDLAYWFDLDTTYLLHLMAPGVTGVFEEEDFKLRRIFSDTIASFIKTGNPQVSLRKEIPGGWPNYDLHNGYYLDFNPRPSIQKNLKREVRQLWEKDLPSWAFQELTHQHTEL